MTTRRVVVWLGVGATSTILAFLLTDAFGAPPAHDIHSYGGIPIEIQIPNSESGSFGGAARGIKASQSLNEVRCQVWLLQRPAPCPDEATLVSAYWPTLIQSPKTLYLGWAPCGQYFFYPVPRFYGFNVEYVDSQRAVLIHCYFAAPWVRGHLPEGVGPTGALSLLLISTDAIPSGSLTVVQEDRIEHLFGDQVTNFTIATATIS